MRQALLSVSHAGYASSSRPRLLFQGGWLPEMGFVPGALVQALPEPDGMVFNLFNDDIRSFSELYNSTKKQGGSILRVCAANPKDYRGPSFVATGKYICKSGLALGDPVVAVCAYGRIRVRKVDAEKLGFENVEVLPLTSIKGRYGPVPKALLCGGWLLKAGFAPHALVTALAAPGSITFTLQNEGIERYSELVKYARENKMKLLKASEGHGIPAIGVSGADVVKAGFAIGDMLAASYSYGEIKLQKLDFKKLGF